MDLLRRRGPCHEVTADGEPASKYREHGWLDATGDQRTVNTRLPCDPRHDPGNLSLQRLTVGAAFAGQYPGRGLERAVQTHTTCHYFGSASEGGAKRKQCRTESAGGAASRNRNAALACFALIEPRYASERLVIRAQTISGNTLLGTIAESGSIRTDERVTDIREHMDRARTHTRIEQGEIKRMDPQEGLRRGRKRTPPGIEKTRPQGLEKTGPGIIGTGTTKTDKKTPRSGVEGVPNKIAKAGRGALLDLPWGIVETHHLGRLDNYLCAIRTLKPPVTPHARGSHRVAGTHHDLDAAGGGKKDVECPVATIGHGT